jgi:hypothetical protein
MTQNITKIINEEEKMMLETAALISSCYAPWALNYYMVAKPSQMTCLPSSLPSYQRLVQALLASMQAAAPFLEFVRTSNFVGSCRAGAKVKDFG